MSLLNRLKRMKLRFGTMFGDAFRSLFQHTATRQYPAERLQAPARMRGKLRWDAARCSGCSLCSKDCPANAIEIITVDKAAKRYAVRYHVDRCAFCAQCVCSCPKGALEMGPDAWELAASDKESFVVCYGGKADVSGLMAGGAPSAAEHSAK